MGGLKTAKSGLKIYVEGSTRHLNVIQNGKKLQPEGRCYDLPQLGRVPLGLCFNLTDVAEARGLWNEREYFPMGDMVLGR